MKVEDYSLPITVPTEAKEMLDNIRRILNNGGYVPQVVSGVPAWTGENGEEVLYAASKTVVKYVYDTTTGTWNYGLPISTKYGWSYMTVASTEAVHTAALSFGYTFSSAPIVITSFLGYKASGTPSSPADFDTGLTKICVQSYAPSTTGCTLAVYSGDGSNFPGNYVMGIGWIAMG